MIDVNKIKAAVDRKKKDRTNEKHIEALQTAAREASLNSTRAFLNELITGFEKSWPNARNRYTSGFEVDITSLTECDKAESFTVGLKYWNDGRLESSHLFRFTALMENAELFAPFNGIYRHDGEEITLFALEEELGAWLESHCVKVI